MNPYLKNSPAARRKRRRDTQAAALLVLVGCALFTLLYIFGEVAR